ncbi:MAG TPA: hypothetical protein VK468_03050 [Pyrinomonadaceae bacterium]|nr:hypothetical protein [Pyrinomonadaceae bacterium]
MKKITATVIFLAAFVITTTAQTTSNIVKVDIPQPQIDNIIKKFTTGEGLFRRALNIYAFNRSATIQTVGMGGQISGTFRKDSYLSFNEAGERFEKILFAPVSTLTEITITPADLENLGGIDPFAIEPKSIAKYNFAYLGKEHIDELDLYVFEVSPKVMPDWKKTTEKLFSGRIWVDDKDLLIVKTKGKAVPEGKERFPIVETWRENIDGKYWFPSFSSSDDELVFENGQAVKMRMRVKYSNYRVGRTDVKIVEEEDVPVEKPTPTPTPAPNKP